MKLTRKKLRQLINEALKPFFMGIAPSNDIQMLINDPNMTNQKLKQLLGDQNPESQRQAIDLFFSNIPGFLNMDEKSAFSYLEQNYPNLYTEYFSHTKGMFHEFDLFDKENPGYKKAFDSAQQRAKDVETRIPIIQNVDDANLEIEKLLYPYRSQLPDLYVNARPRGPGYSVRIYTANLPILKQMHDAAKAMGLIAMPIRDREHRSSDPDIHGKYRLPITFGRNRRYK